MKKRTKKEGEGAGGFFPPVTFFREPASG